MKKFVLSLVMLLCAAAFGYADIGVSGEGSVNAKPDQATINLSITGEAPLAADAMRHAQQSLTNVVKVLDDAGIDIKKNVRTAQFQVSPVYTYGNREEPQFKGYKAVNHLCITLNDISGNKLEKKIGEVLDGTAKWSTRISSVEFGFTGSQTMMDEARKLAIVDARRKAEIYAKSSGVKLGKLKSMSEQYTYSRNYSSEGYRTAGMGSPVMSGELPIRVTITATYETE